MDTLPEAEPRPDKMASMTVDEPCVWFATTCEGDIYFKVENRDYESDSFKEDNKCFMRMIQNKGQQFLVVDEELLKFEERNTIQCRKEDCWFKIYPYINSDPEPRGRPVILMVSCKEKNRVICCHEEENRKGVYAKLQDQPLPKDIKESCNEALFFLQRLKERSNCYRLASSFWPGWFLAFEVVGDNLVKLVLRKYEVDVVDEGFHFLKP